MSYIRHDKNNSAVSPQPGSTTVNQFSADEGWSTVTYKNFNADYIAYTYNSVAGIGTRTPADYQRHDTDNNSVGVGTYQRYGKDNTQVTG